MIFLGVGKEITGPCEIEMFDHKWMYLMPNGHGQDYEFSFDIEIISFGDTLKEF